MSNPRYLEGSIAERYISWESVTYCKSYLQLEEHEESNPPIWNISSVSQLVQPCIMDTTGNIRLTEEQTAEAHWQILTDTEEAQDYVDTHLQMYIAKHGDDYDERRLRRSFHRWFLRYVRKSHSLFFLYKDPKP